MARHHIHRDIDKLINELQQAYPGVTVDQLQVKHPGADDDGLWFFRYPGSPNEVQVESSSGSVPFLVEADHAPPMTAESVSEAFSLVAARLGLNASTA